MNNNKEAMRMAIMAKVIEQELFKNSKEVTITNEYYNGTLMPIIIKRSTRLIVDAIGAVKQGMPPMNAVSFVFFKEELMSSLKDMVENKDCDNCPAKDECKDKQCKSDKAPSDMSNEELNTYLDHFKNKKSC